MFETEEAQRRIGTFAWVMAWVGLVVGQLHALARAATADGAEDWEYPLFAAWGRSATDWLSPLLGWADPDLVYVTYGKIWLPVFAAFTLCAYVVYRRRRPARVEKWAWRAAILGYVVATIGVFFDYWTQWTGSYTDETSLEYALFTAGWYVTLPGLMLTLLASTALGLTLLVKRVRQVLPSLLLMLVIPLAMGIVEVTSLGSAALPVMFAFGLLGRRLAREDRLDEGASPRDDMRSERAVAPSV